MRRITSILLSLLFDLADLCVTTVTYSHGYEFESRFRQGIFHFQYTSSMFDIWILDLVRCLFYIGSLISLWYNPVDSLRRIDRSKRISIVFMVLFWMYSITKLLVVSESSDLQDRWFWIQFAWSFISAIWFPIHFGILRRIELSSPEYSLNINESPADGAPLIEDDASDDENEGKDEDTKEPKANKVTIFHLFSYSLPDLPYLMAGCFFLLTAAVGKIFIPYYTGQVIDSIVIEKSESSFIRNIIIMSVISFFSAIASGLRSGSFTFTMARLNIRVRNLLFSSLLRQEIGFFDKVKTGDITSRLTTDTTVMSDTVSLNINIFLRSVVQGIGTVIFMFKLSWRLSLLTVIAIPIMVYISELYGNYYQKLSEKVQDSLAKANHVAEEVVSTIRTVRSFANEDGERDRYKLALADTYKLNKKQAIAFTGYQWCNQIFELALTVGVLYYGGHLVLTKYISGGSLVSFILYQLELGMCIDEIGSVYTGLMEAVGASAKVFQYIHRKPEIENTGQLVPEKFNGEIKFENVSFSYPTRKDTLVLEDVSLNVHPGEVVALVGPSGGGKSSCINLIQHYYENVKGRILLDDVPIKDYDHRYLHNKIALVGQEPVLYARSIADNIRYGLDEKIYDLQTVQEVAKMANAHQFITEMKDQYDTECGEKGIQLSGGQKQRVAIARALIRNPSILLLDEATSALDSESEHLVQQAIYQNLNGRTVIIIAHRLSTVEKADRIIVIDKGHVIEHGTHSQLLGQDGLYSKLVQRQLLGLDDAGKENDCKPIVHRSCSENVVSMSFSMSSPKIEFHSPSSHGSPTVYGSLDT